MNNPYGNPTPESNPYAPRPIITKKNIALSIVLSMVTCGIYSLYWLYTLTEETKLLSGDNSMPSGVMVIIFNLVTCGVYGSYWAYKQGELLENALVSRGIRASNQGVMFLILCAVGMGPVAYAIMQDHINKMV